MAEPTRRTVTQDDSLPPVEPPSAAFLVQLFLVPAIIVGIIVAVWLAFHWLAQLGNDPEGYVRTLRRANEGRWQAALNLANDLRGPGGGTLKADTKLAADLAGILSDEVASGRLKLGGHAGEQSRTLSGYLCRALGEFAVPEAAPPLVERARDTGDPETARAAVEAIAVLTTNLSAAGAALPDAAAVTDALLAASRSDDAGLRSAAAFTLGVVGGAAAHERLDVLVEDPADDVRYNAAIGLARQGRESGYATLAEMLGLPDAPAEPGDEAAQSQRYRRALIVVNALKAVGLLVDAGAMPPESITQPLTELAADPVGDVRAAAAALAKKIERVSAAAGQTR
ncbi:MAG: HEAT repeat domain-containing protein [Planctomycetaceae bacterium]